MTLYTMTGVDWTTRYPWIVEGAKAIKADVAVIDAEAAACDDTGLAIFNRMVERVHDDSVFAYAFDLLTIEGEDIRALPIEERKSRLAAVLPRGVLSHTQCGIQFSDHYNGEGDLVFTQACLMGLEGIVSKRLGSRYRSGRCTSWVKVKNKAAPGYTRFKEGGE